MNTISGIRREISAVTTATLFLALHANRMTPRLRKILRDRTRVRNERQNIISYLGLMAVNDELHYHRRDLNETWWFLLTEEGETP